jgi:hypothetical protein
MNNQLKIPKSYTKVTSFVQAEFHFNNDKLLGLPISWFRMVYARKLEENSYELAVVPLFGRADVYTGNADSMKGMLDVYTFCVVGDVGSFTQKKPSLLDKFAYFLQKLFDRSDR